MANAVPVILPLLLILIFILIRYSIRGTLTTSSPMNLRSANLTSYTIPPIGRRVRMFGLCCWERTRSSALKGGAEEAGILTMKKKHAGQCGGEVDRALVEAGERVTEGRHLADPDDVLVALLDHQVI